LHDIGNMIGLVVHRQDNRHQGVGHDAPISARNVMFPKLVRCICPRTDSLILTRMDVRRPFGRYCDGDAERLEREPRPTALGLGRIHRPLPVTLGLGRMRITSHRYLRSLSRLCPLDEEARSVRSRSTHSRSPGLSPFVSPRLEVSADDGLRP
jgi:hypothetical protein